MSSLALSAPSCAPTDGMFSAIVESLQATDSRWRVLRTDGGMTTVVRMGNDGSNDFLCLSRETTYWFREDSDGRRTLAMNGTLDFIIHAIRHPAADDPSALLPRARDSARDERL